MSWSAYDDEDDADDADDVRVAVTGLCIEAGTVDEAEGELKEELEEARKFVPKGFGS